MTPPTSHNCLELSSDNFAVVDEACSSGTTVTLEIPRDHPSSHLAAAADVELKFATGRYFRARVKQVLGCDGEGFVHMLLDGLSEFERPASNPES